MDLFVFVFATLLLVYVIYRLLFTSKGAGRTNAPPSLPSLPIIGSLPFLSGVEDLPQCLTEKAKRYGNVFSFNAGSRYTVVLNGHEAIQEAMLKRSNELAGRADMYTDQHVCNVERRGIIYKQYGEAYKKNRIHSMAVLKQFGFGDQRTMKSKIHSEIGHMMTFINVQNNKPFDPAAMFQLCTLNVMYQLLFSERFEEGDRLEVYIRERVREYVDAGNPIYEAFPMVVHLPMYRKRLDALRHESDKFRLFFADKIRECLLNAEATENFVVQYVNKTGSDYDEKELNYILRDFVIAGTETTATELCWALILLGNHPPILQRLQIELDSVVQRDRLPSMEDKAKLPYMEATILEIMRARTIAPLAVPHVTLSDTQIQGFDIPQGAMILINLLSAHMDPKIWPDPDKFRPERHLDVDGRVVKRDLVVPFSLGKRACPGEVLAMQEMFLIVSAIVHQFDILPPEGEASIRDEMKFIRVMSPAPFELCLVKRE